MASHKDLIGKVITNIRPAIKEELDSFGWEESFHGPPPVIELSGGSSLIPSGDYEGNMHGTLFGWTVDGEALHICPPPSNYTGDKGAWENK